MNKLTQRLAALTVLCCAAASPALAASSAASSVSDSIATSIGSVSDSVKKSSDGSSKATGMAAGDYQVIDIAAAPDRPGMARMKLQAVADRSEDGEFYLYLPQLAVEQARLAAGQVVSARQRSYGMEFAKVDKTDKADMRQAFFLVLDDAWHRELQSNAVVL